jgi:hypothetical protein
MDRHDYQFDYLDLALAPLWLLGCGWWKKTMEIQQ